MTSDAAVAFGWLRQRNGRLQETLLNSRTGGARCPPSEILACQTHNYLVRPGHPCYNEWAPTVKISMDSSLLTISKSYSLSRSGQSRSGLLWSLSSHQQPISLGGFTLVELLVVVVILGVLSAVGIPAYFAQTRTANINAANQAVLAAAKACAAAQVTGETRFFTPGRGVSGSCGVTSANRDFRSVNTSFTTLNTQAVARVAASTGEVTLVTSAN